MSTLVRKRRTKPGERLLTAADLAMLPDELASGPVLYELDNGRLVIMPPPGDFHGGVEANLTTQMKNHVDRHHLGKVRCGEVGIVLWRDPDRVVSADVAFIATSLLPIRVSPEGYLETIPDLVVEIRSKNDSMPEILDKVKDYLLAGVRVVLVAEPAKKTVTAYRRGRKPKVFGATDTLTVEDVIPGFQMSVAEVFHV